MTTFGIEEEFFFLDPDTMQPADVAEHVYRRLAVDPRWQDVTMREFLASKIEHASRVFTEMTDAATELHAFRR